MSSVTLSAAGKAMTAEGATAATAVAFAVQGRVAFTAPGVDGEGAVAKQLPRSAAVAPGASQHLHDEHEGICSAADEQQQPPAQRLVWQSKLLTHVSPGVCAMHAPDMKAHALQLA